MIKSLFIKYKELILYLIFGVLTTVISIGSYTIFTKTFLNPNNAFLLQVANILSWIISVLFAYVTNRKYVFESHDDNVIREISKFFMARLLSLALDMLIMFIGVSLLKMGDILVKCISQVVVILFNYLFSRIFVFKKD